MNYANMNLALLNELLEMAEECDPNLVQDLLVEFQKSAVVLINEIEKGVLKKDASLIENAAHKLKSSSGALGLQKLSDVSYFLMEKGRLLDVVPCELPARNLQKLYDEQMVDLHRYLAEYRSKKAV